MAKRVSNIMDEYQILGEANCPLSIIHYQLSIINCPLSIVHYQLSIINWILSWKTQNKWIIQTKWKDSCRGTLRLLAEPKDNFQLSGCWACRSTTLNVFVYREGGYNLILVQLVENNNFPKAIVPILLLGKNYQLSIVHYPLCIVHYPLCIVHYPLSIVHC